MRELIEKQAAIDAINRHFGFNIEEEYGSAVQETINGLPSAQPEPLTDAEPDLPNSYARSVAIWLLHYAVKCYELKGRYTPYEIVNWVLNDWRKENGLD